jgi:adenylate cyclase
VVEEEREALLQFQVQSDQEAIQQDRFLNENEITDEIILRRDYEKLRITYELQRDIGIELDLDKVLQRILNCTFEFLNCDRGIFLMADEDGNLKPCAYKTKKKDKKFALSSTLIKHIQDNKTGILSTDALKDERFDGSKSIIAEGTRSTLAVPVLDGDALLAILAIDSMMFTNAYSQKDLWLLTNIANQTARFIKNLNMTKKIEKDEATRKRFQKLLSPDLAEMVVSGKLKVEKGGENRIATVMFADIRNFTPMSENAEASEILNLLNDYYEVMVDIIFHYEGTVDKFIGDAMMVIWGAPIAHDDDARRAVNAAIDIQEMLVEFNKTREAEGQQQIKTGIGINTGSLVAGYIGSTQTMSYSVIGDTVNTASRLCASAKGGQIYISDETYQEIKNEFNVEKLKSLPVKGKIKPVRIYNVTGRKKH